MRKWWLPLLKGSDVTHCDSRPDKPTMLDSALRALGENSGRFTLSLYFSVALALISAFWLLWQSSERQLHRALVAESRNLAEIADQHIARGDAATAILLALEALPDTDAVEARKRRRPYVAAAERAL